MSSVTSVIMIVDYIENRGNRIVNLLNGYFANPDNSQHDKSPFVDVKEHCGGTKGMWGYILTKGCNYLALDEFLNWLVKQKWDYPDQCQILIHREYANDEHYHHKLIGELIRDKCWEELSWKGY